MLRAGGLIPEGLEVIRVSQWSEIRSLYFVEHVPKREIARRFEIDIKTVRRAIRRADGPESWKEERSGRGRRLDPHRGVVIGWLREQPKLTAKRIGRLLVERGLLETPAAGRTLREFVAEVKGELFAAEAFVHRTHVPGETMEVDFGHEDVVIGGRELKAHYLVVTLPASNAYFAKAYSRETLECLFDGVLRAFRYFGGMPKRVVFDNTSLCVKRILRGPDRLETKRFEGFRGAFPFSAEYCAPGKGNEKGSVETGVKYVRRNCLQPLARFDSMDALNAAILAELERDLPLRRHPDGGSCAEALSAERQALRPLPLHVPEACVMEARIVNKFGHVQHDTVTYSVPAEHVRKPATVKVFAEMVQVSIGDRVVAQHPRLFQRGALSLSLDHILDTLERKSRAAPEATAVYLADLPAVFETLRQELHRRTDHANREWVRVLKLTRTHSLDVLEGAVEAALLADTPRLAAIEMLLRQRSRGPALVPPAVPLADREDLGAMDVPAADLSAYDALDRTGGVDSDGEEVA